MKALNPVTIACILISIVIFLAVLVCFIVTCGL